MLIQNLDVCALLWPCFLNIKIRLSVAADRMVVRVRDSGPKRGLNVGPNCGYPEVCILGLRNELTLLVSVLTDGVNVGFMNFG